MISIIADFCMESRIVTRINGLVMHSLIRWTSKMVMNGSWLQDTGMIRKGEQTNKINMEGK